MSDIQEQILNWAVVVLAVSFTALIAITVIAYAVALFSKDEIDNN